MSYTSIRESINKILRSYNYYSRVAVEFPAEHKIVYMTKYEVMALQLEAATVYKHDGQEGFNAFTSQFIIYNGSDKENSVPMIMRTDGLFENEFQTGFYDVDTNILYKLL